MITLIEIDGFKTFKDFKVELAPFQVIVGPNGSGKSNLFDALHLLSRLAELDLQSAFQSSYDDPQRLRGDAHELFTLFPNGQRSNHVRIAVEMLVDRKVQDDFGREVELAYTRLRYELEVVLRKDKPDWEVLCITHEALKSIPESEDSWCKAYELSSQNGWLPSSAGNQKVFISTTLPKSQARVAEAAPRYNAEPYEDESEEPSVSPTTAGTTIHLHSDGQSRGKTAVASKMKRTILSSIADAEFPHAFAVRKEMQSWRFLHLSHEALHRPSSVNAPSFLVKDGSNLPTMIAHLQLEDQYAIHDILRDFVGLVPDVVGVEVKKDPVRNEYTIWVKYQEGLSFPSQVLSDGTLHLLALATLNNDYNLHGVICFEEPENGIHPTHLKRATHLLRGLATDFRDSLQAQEPLRQVLITTHSPLFIGQPDVVDALLFAYLVTRVEPSSRGIPPFRITQMVPVVIDGSINPQTDIDRGKATYTLSRVQSLLMNDDLGKAVERLEDSHTMLYKR